MLRSRRQISLFVPLVLSLLLLSAPLSANPDVLSIAEARSLPLGSVVTVDGSVTTPSGAFESSFFDVGFGLQDKTAGIYVSLQTNLGVAPRAQATVTGMLVESFGLLLLVPASPDDVDFHGKGPKVDPRFLRTSAVSESTEGLLVRVAGTITRGVINDLPFGYIFFVDDGSGEAQIFVNVQTGIDIDTLAVGQFVSVTGFSSQFSDHYEIDPRSPADIVIAAP